MTRTWNQHFRQEWVEKYHLPIHFGSGMILGIGLVGKFISPQFLNIQIPSDFLLGLGIGLTLFNIFLFKLNSKIENEENGFSVNSHIMWYCS